MNNGMKYNTRLLTTRRWLRGLSQQQVAEKAGLTQATVSAAENGRANAASLKRITRVLGLEMRSLLESREIV